MNTNEGMGLCPPEEYKRAYSRRLQASSLESGSLYVAYFNVKDYERDFKVISTVGEIALRSSGEPIVELIFYSEKQQTEEGPYQGEMHDGRWNLVVGGENKFVLRLSGSPQSHQLVDGCLVIDEEGEKFNDELQAMLEKELLPGQKLRPGKHDDDQERELVPVPARRLGADRSDRYIVE